MSYISAKLPVMLKRLLLDYATKGFAFEQDMVRSCRFRVIENTGYDNLDGGIEGHDIVFYLPKDILSQVPLSEQSATAEALRGNLGYMIPGIAREFINEVQFELADDDDEDFQSAFAFSAQPVVNPDTLTFWTPGQVRLFVSHKDEHKGAAKQLADALDKYGVSSFVAHDTIKPLKEWRTEIMKGLQSMEIMLVFLTDNFQDSYWCQQEVGFALGKGIPVISLKLEKHDPPGFISHVQAARGALDDAAASASNIYSLLAEALNAPERLQNGLISAFCESTTFDEARLRFDRMNCQVRVLTDKQLEMIISSFTANESLYKAIYLDNKYSRLARFLSQATGRQYAIDGRQVMPVKEDVPADMPF